MSNSGCDHGRMCVSCPNRMLTQATEHLRDAAYIMETVHQLYDGITVKGITTWVGDTKAELKMERSDE